MYGNGNAAVVAATRPRQLYDVQLRSVHQGTLAACLETELNRISDNTRQFTYLKRYRGHPTSSGILAADIDHTLGYGHFMHRCHPKIIIIAAKQIVRAIIMQKLGIRTVIEIGVQRPEVILLGIIKFESNPIFFDPNCDYIPYYVYIP